MVIVELIDGDNNGIKMGAIKFGWVSPDSWDRRMRSGSKVSVGNCVRHRKENLSGRCLFGNEKCPGVTQFFFFCNA